VGFLLGDVALAVDAARVQAVARAEAVIPVPFARRCFAGVMVKEGRLVTVVDLSRVASLWNEVPTGGGEQVIVLSTGGIEAGFLARSVEAFTSTAGQEPGEEGPPRPPAAVREGILSGTLRAAGRIYGLLRAEAALAAAGVPLGTT